MAQAILDPAVVEGFGGELLRDGDPGYDDARRVFNAGVDRRPAVIARCTGVADVIDALALAREHGLDVSVKGGGHAVAGHAVVEDGLTIDLRPMNRVRVDPERRTAWCGGGTKWGELDRETQAFGLAVTGGRLADTGVGGLTLGGGSGWIDRKYGLTVDSLISAEVVTADGRHLVASADRNPDLFWALKGGGGNFGVVTGFEFALHEVGPLIYGGMLLFPIDAAVDLLKAYRGFMDGAPGRDLRRRGDPVRAARRSSSPRRSAASRCWESSRATSGRSRRASARSPRCASGGPALELVGPMPYTAVQGLIAPGNPPGRHHYWKAGLLGELSDEAIETFVSHASQPLSPFTASPDAPDRRSVRARAGGRHPARLPRRQVELPPARAVGTPDPVGGGAQHRVDARLRHGDGRVRRGRRLRQLHRRPEPEGASRPASAPGTTPAWWRSSGRMTRTTCSEATRTSRRTPSPAAG